MLTCCESLFQTKEGDLGPVSVRWQEGSCEIRVIHQDQWNFKAGLSGVQKLSLGSVVPKLCSCVLEKLEDLKITVAWLLSPRLYVIIGAGCGLGVRSFKSFTEHSNLPRLSGTTELINTVKFSSHNFTWEQAHLWWGGTHRPNSMWSATSMLPPGNDLQASSVTRLFSPKALLKCVSHHCWIILLVAKEFLPWIPLYSTS